MEEEIYTKYIDVKDKSVKEVYLEFNPKADYTEIFKELRQITEEHDVKFNITTVNLLEMFKTFLIGAITENKYILPHEVITSEDKIILKEELNELESLLASITSIYGVINTFEDATEIIVTENLDLVTEEYVPTFEARYTETKEVFYSRTGKHPSEIGVPEAES